MPYLTHIHLVHYKNHASVALIFNPSINALVGNNGIGKTNLLDAIYYLGLARSYFTKIDKMNVQHEKEGFSITGSYKNSINVLPKAEYFTLKNIVREDGKKELYHDNVLIKKQSEYIGKAPVVIITPDDIELINEGSEQRRKYMDTILCQTNPTYLQTLVKYQKILLQRNALLKQIAQYPYQPTTLLDTYDEQLNNYATTIVKLRTTLTDTLVQLVRLYYNYLASNADNPSLHYETQLHNNDLLTLLKQNRQKDINTQRTNYGIHKDEITFTLNNYPLKNVASQGQKKTLLLALKLAEFNLLKSSLNITPILLLDDIFEKLDNLRISKLFSLINEHFKCQIFITDTNEERVKAQLKNYKYNIINL